MEIEGLEREHGTIDMDSTKAERDARTKTRTSWTMMRQRCLNPKSTGYERYGGNGITICERWASFENFLHDMGLRPEGTSLDRIDNKGNYEPTNCRWATRKQQQNNCKPNEERTINGILGRPPKTPEDKASATITIKLTQGELAELQAAIGPGLRTWIRELILKHARRLKAK